MSLSKSLSTFRSNISAFFFRGPRCTTQRFSVTSRKTVGCLLQQTDHILTLRAASFTATSLPFLPRPMFVYSLPFSRQGVFQLQLYIFPVFYSRLQRQSPLKYSIMIGTQVNVNLT